MTVSTLSGVLILQPTGKARKNIEMLLSVCSADIWQSEDSVTANEGEPTWDTVTTKIINIFAYAGLSFATEPQETSQWKRLFAFGSNNLNRYRAISLRLWTLGHTLGHLATGVPFSCALQQTGTTGPLIPWPTPFPRTISLICIVWVRRWSSFSPTHLANFWWLLINTFLCSFFGYRNKN